MVDFVPLTLYRGFAPKPDWGTSVPQVPSPDHHLVNPPIVKSWVHPCVSRI